MQTPPIGRPDAVVHRRTVDLGAKETSTLDLWQDREEHELTTTLAAITYDSTPSLRLRPVGLFAEAVFFTSMALAFGHAVGSEFAGVVSVFLTAAALSSRFKRLGTAAERLAKGRGGLELLRAAGVFFASFGGMFGAFLVFAVLVGPEGTEVRFGFALSAADAREATLDPERFRHHWGLLGHNLLVMLSAYLLAFVYRGFGGLLALAWNACSWAVALVFLLAPAEPNAATVGVALVALLPHMVVEATAYALAALAGMRTGIYLLRRTQAVTAGLWLLTWAAGLCVAGGLIEMFWPYFVLSLWLPGG